MLQFIQFTEVLFPCLVDNVQQDRLFKRFYHFLTLAVVSGFQAARDVVHALTVRDGDKDILVHVSLGFVYLLDYRISNLCHAVRLALELFHCHIEGCFSKLFLLFVTELFFVERHFHGKSLQEVHFAVFVIGSFNGCGNTVPDHIYDIHSDTFTHQGVATLGIDNCTLLIHHVIIFQQTLTDTEVVFFHLLLCTLNGVGDHLVLNHFTFLEAETVHYTGDAVGREQTHQVVFQ